MKRFANITDFRGLAVGPVLAIAITACGGDSAVLGGSEPGITADDEITEGPVVLGSPVSIAVDSENDSEVDGVAVDDDVTDDVASDDGVTEESAVADSPVSIDEDSDTDSVDNDASNGATASDFLADRTALGAVKIMAVGDSITHGVAGVSSYRREFTSLLEAESCSFTMVGSQLTSRSTGVDPECIDTEPVGDGWGWDGTQSCLVGESSGVEVFRGAHEGYSSHRADHFLTGRDSSSGSNPGIRVSMETFAPDVVLLHLGSVDLFNEQGVSNALIDLDDVLDAIYEVQPETLVLMANVIPWFSDKPYEGIGGDIERLGDGVQRIIDERFDPFLKLVDVRSGFTESMMLDDLIHPNASGERHIADAFANVYQSFADCSL